MPFPLPFVPKADYHKGPGRAQHHRRYFGAEREGGRRKHAGCDLLAPEGTEIYAIDDGVVYEVAAEFYHGTGVIALKHKAGHIARYCEVLSESLRGIKKGQQFKAGDVIAKVGKMFASSMLHFELYAGTDVGPLTVKAGKSPFKRRSDLLNPTAFLDRLRPYVRISHGPILVQASTP